MPGTECCDLGHCLESLMVTSLLVVDLCGFSHANMHFQPDQNTIPAFVIWQTHSEGCYCLQKKDREFPIPININDLVPGFGALSLQAYL